MSFLNDLFMPLQQVFTLPKGAEQAASPLQLPTAREATFMRGNQATRHQHLARMLVAGQGFPDPAWFYHVHWAPCIMGDTA